MQFLWTWVRTALAPWLLICCDYRFQRDTKELQNRAGRDRFLDLPRAAVASAVQSNAASFRSRSTIAMVDFYTKERRKDVRCIRQTNAERCNTKRLNHPVVLRKRISSLTLEGSGATAAYTADKSGFTPSPDYWPDL